MQAMVTMNGARLAYVVVPIEEPVRRKVHQWKKGKGIVESYVEQPGGFLVYFPRGHVIRIKDRAELRHYKLDREPKIINLDGLSDPNSPIGRLMFAQDEKSRRNAAESLETQVMQLAQIKSGRIEVCKDQAVLDEQTAEMEAA